GDHGRSRTDVRARRKIGKSQKTKRGTKRMITLTRRNTLGLGLGAAAAALLTSRTAGAADPIKIGYPANLTGIQASLDGPMLNGAKLAASEINDAGGVL